MPRISVFDMLKIGVGPSSSHTLGPWRAAQRFIHDCTAEHDIRTIQQVRVELYGSLAKTGKGHGTDIAVMFGLRDEDPTTCDTAKIPTLIDHIRAEKWLKLQGRQAVNFDPDQDIIFHFDQTLPFHPNGLRFTAEMTDGAQMQGTYYSVGGGFVVQEGESSSEHDVLLPYPCDVSDDLLAHCERDGLAIWQMVWANELVWRPADQVRAGLLRIWHTMRDCIYRGCHAEGVLPGGLNVRRRASVMHRQLIQPTAVYDSPATWLRTIQTKRLEFDNVVRWISCFALAVNEENASFGRVVTAPTNGAAGVLPAVLAHYVCQHHPDDEGIMRFLLVAGEIGTFFKKGATISAAQGGCQAEIGVSSAMAAAALTECLGGSPAQALMAAEIAMEHHLGLTCDPIRGLVQIPCIERNAIGAMKAITAANIALASDPQHAKVSLDGVIKTMWQTAQDMHEKYKETSEGGLAVHISVNVAEC